MIIGWHLSLARQRKKVGALSNYNKPRLLAIGIGSEQAKLLSSLLERMSKRYSFRKDEVMKIFKDALPVGLQPPKCKLGKETYKKGHPNFYPYLRVLGNSIENGYVFKNWIERQYQEGKITLSKGMLLNQPVKCTNFVSVAPQEKTLWRQDVGSTSESVQAGKGSQVP